jgi:ABC-type bacteriocin/lantibiotic exporter with double-glycine peptidase domain
MYLKVPYFKQESGKTCGVACLRMVLGYLGKNFEEKELAKQIKVYSFGTFNTDLGYIALKLGYKVTIHTIHLRLLGPLNLEFGTEITTKILDSLAVKPNDRTNYESWKDLLRPEET